ncbi:DNA polymerase III subunit beta [Thermosipho melanesiensis]|uniref:Beta sliding clamp n=2 Tax=Thermosipho melanesiensis TaxID=46541 RepID=A6LKF1_THEM4|nr:DNA polymerase III subunit beta [Thermosipho melanesiensis]ABR30402.1 DNA polymerase III, beta subunit [Thermosipho melanesiensis BI429]APT73563.1 DNA polymerase III subunit beta [Thermosipho melanesiensis]OOC37514.1 DNA polymerase III subunit beta [Thermosipho melanesiensis]OOC39553.1 DNA polymerase III subunit beta [Thermosipho melanesiensis]OOC39570.1 DNA polymerase III subunit beta [Thermosipho melanesiensis]
MLSFLINKSELEKKISVAANAVGSKTVDPILQCLLFSLENETQIYATDMQTFVISKLNVYEINGNGKFAVDAKLLEEIVKNVDTEQILFSYDMGKLVLKSGKSSFNLSTHSEPDKFPQIELEESGIKFELETSILSEMIDRVLFCASTESAMRALNGVYWEAKGGYLRLVASDGYRLALTEQKVNIDADFDFILSLKSMKELDNLIKQTDEPILTVKFDHKKVWISAGDITVIMRIVEEVFPDYKRVLPKVFKTRIIFNKEEFLEALKRIMIISKRGDEKVRLQINDNILVLNSQSPEYGEVNEEISIEQEGEDLSINFNPKFLNEAVKKIEEDEVVFNFVDDLSPMQINSKDVNEYLYIVLPVRA